MSEVKRAQIASSQRGATVVPSEAQVLFGALGRASLREVEFLIDSSQRRTNTPLRKSFVRNDDSSIVPPLARLVSTRGRGAAVPVALYLGLVRRSSAPPYSTHLSSRRWAALLGLDDPGGLGARRVADAISRLHDRGLIEIEKHRGDASTVTLLHEDGGGSPYVPPSQSVRRGQATPDHLLYFKLPDDLWRGYIQSMSAPALAMLLVLASEPSSSTVGTWWSVSEFPRRYGISASMRARGTSELRNMGLLRVRKTKMDTARGGNDDERDRVRNLYLLRGAARDVDLTPISAKSAPPLRRASRHRSRK